MIRIICVGKIKEKYFVSAIKEYMKRLSRYTKIDVVEIPDESNAEKAVKIEGDKILDKIKKDEYVIAMDIGGNMISSLDLSGEVKKRSNYQLSFSKMTFPHQLFRVILLEQIYRAYKINNNETYHK